MKKLVTLCLCAWLLAAAPAFAGGVVQPTRSGDGDPFPVACRDFTGVWRSDQNHLYFVDQKGCGWLQIRKSEGNNNVSLTIVPDGVSRNAFGAEWKGTVLHRWNSLHFGAVVETHRTMLYSEKKVTEFVTLEEVNDNLLLENTYRVSEGLFGGDEPKYEYHQQVFRRMSGTPQPKK